MKKTLLALAILGTVSAAAQEMPYTLTVLNEPYAELSEAWEANEGQTWDDPELLLPMGFTFQLMDELMENVLLMAPGAQIGNPINQDSVHFLEPYLSDILDAGYDTTSISPILFTTEGMPGSRIFKMEWRDVAFYNEWAEGSTANRTNFQMWLYEGTNVIEYRYGANTIKSGDFIHFAGAPIIGVGTNADVTQGGWENFWMLHGDPLNPDIYNYTNPDEPGPILDGEPPAGTVYRFTPTFTSLSEPAPQLAVHVYPTITTDVLNVTWYDDRVFYTIYDIAGRIVMQDYLTRGAQQVAVSGLSAAQYILHIRNENGSYTQLFTKQ